MKKSIVLKFIITLSLTLFLFSACGDDDNPTSAGSNDLIGVWKAVSSTTLYGSESNPDSTEAFTYTPDLVEFTLTLNDDNTWSVVFIIFGLTDNSSGTWSVSGSTITVKEPGEEDDTFQYVISGNNLTLSSSETISGYTIFEVVVYTKQ